MGKFYNLPLLLYLFFNLVLSSSLVLARDYFIYAVTQDVPMGYKNEKLKKNFYVNMGNTQGVGKDASLDVYRNILVYNPYQNSGQYSNYRLKVGELNVIQSDEESSIAISSKFYQDEKAPSLEVTDFMIGDQVQVHVER